MHNIQIAETSSVDAATTAFTTISANASAHTKGNYTQLIAATARDYTDIIVFPHVLSGMGALIDIAVGTDGQEQIIIPNLHVTAQSISAYTTYDLPDFFIPAGSRLSARCQTNTTSGSARLGIVGLSGGFSPRRPLLSSLTDYGINTTTTRGTSIDPGGTINTKGAWTVIATTSRFHRGFFIGIGGQFNTARTTASLLMDVAIGTTGNEQVVLSNLPLRANSTSNMVHPVNFPLIKMPLPTGTQIQVRASCTINDATDRTFDAMFWGAN